MSLWDWLVDMDVLSGLVYSFTTIIAALPVSNHIIEVILFPPYLFLAPAVIRHCLIYNNLDTSFRPWFCKATAVAPGVKLRRKRTQPVNVKGKWKRMGDGNEGANCFQWILKSNSLPQCMGLVVRKWNIDDQSENKGKWPRCMIDLKATDLYRTCLNRQHILPGVYGSVYAYHRFYIAEMCKYYIISICILYYS